MRHTLISLCVLQAFTPFAWAQVAASEQPSLELQATTVTGEMDYETAQGPVKGYRATRSASATRTDTSIHETPQSISVVPKDVVEDIGATR
ncbi:TonB-dependent siderophore receptor, partial [Pseudomonas sp. KHB2.9]